MRRQRSTLAITRGPKAEFCVTGSESGLGKRRPRKGPPLAGWIRNEKNVLPFGELEALAGAFLTVLLSLMSASIARQQTEPLELAAEFGIKFDKCAGDAEASRTGLTGNASTSGEDQNIKAVGQFGREERLAHIGAGRLVWKVIFERPMIDRDLTFTGPEDDTRGGGLTTSGSQLLN